MELKRSLVLAFAMTAAVLTACDRRERATVGPSRPALVVQIEAAAASPTPDEAVVTVPSGSDIWLVATPYNLEESWASLGLNLSASDKERLVQANVASENVLVARITSEGVAETAILGPQFAASPATFVVRAGDTLTLQRRNESRSLLIVKGVP